MNKKGYLKTLEAIIAVIIVLMVVLISLSFDNPETEEVPAEVRALQDTIFDVLQNDEDHRGYIIGSNVADIPLLLDTFIDDTRFGYGFTICRDYGCENSISYPTDPIEPPEGSQVYADSFVIQEPDGEVFDLRLFRLYIWYKEL